MVSFVSATPSFPVTDLAALTEFYIRKLGFEPIYQTKVRTLLVRDAVGLLLRLEPETAERRTAQCRMGVGGIKPFYKECKAAGLLTDDCKLHRTDWGKDEFSLVDPDGNTITFFSA